MATELVEVIVCDVCEETIPEPFRPQVCYFCGQLMCLKHTWRIETRKAIPDDPNRPYAGGTSMTVCETCKDGTLKRVEGIK